MEQTLSPAVIPPRAASPRHPIKDVLEQKNEIGAKYVVIMVGLPARGKSYICKKLSRYLNWCGFNTRVFNVGNRRRVMHPVADNNNKNSDSSVKMQRLSASDKIQSRATSQNIDIPGAKLRAVPQMDSSTPLNSSAIAVPGATIHDATFFDSGNTEAKVVREQLALDTLEEIIKWLRSGGKVAIHDATNSTVERRQALLQRLSKEPGVKPFFIESICEEGDVLEKNIQMKLSGPDYMKMDPVEAIRDFKARIANYERVYQTISEAEEKHSFIKIINVGSKVIANRIHGYLPSHCVFYLMQMHIKERNIWITRHGESLYNLQDRVGGDPELSPFGVKYTDALAKFIKQNAISIASKRSEDSLDENDDSKFKIWTSCLQRAIEVGERFDRELVDVTHIRFLNEIYSGSFEGLSYEEIKNNYPEEYEQRQKNKLVYRYPGAGGESYLDVIERLRPVIIELERLQSDVLVVTHQVVLRTILAYFLGIPLQEMPTLSVPLHTLYCLKPKPYGADLYKYAYNPESEQIEYVGQGLEISN